MNTIQKILARTVTQMHFSQTKQWILPALALGLITHGTINGSNVQRGRQLEERGKHLDAFVVSILKVFVVRKYLRLKNN